MHGPYSFSSVFVTSVGYLCERCEIKIFFVRPTISELGMNIYDFFVLSTISVNFLHSSRILIF